MAEKNIIRVGDLVTITKEYSQALKLARGVGIVIGLIPRGAARVRWFKTGEIYRYNHIALKVISNAE